MENTINFNESAPAPTQDVNVSTSAMLVELSVSQWSGRKTDKRASEDINTRSGADRDVASVTKNILGNCDELKAIGKLVGQVRNNYHYPMTLPWSDTGLRLIPTAHYFEYTKSMDGFKQEFDDLVNTFVDKYEWEVSLAQAKLGSLFDPADYPSVESVRNKFAFNVSFMPVPEAGDFRVDIAHEQKDALAGHYHSFYQRQLKAAMDKVWNDTYTTLKHISDKLDWESDPSVERKRIFASTIDNLMHMVRMLETCNFTNDPEMSRMQRQLAVAFNGVTADSLKNNTSLRLQTKRDVDAAIKSLPSLDF
jgi:hypothetical protein